MGKKSIQMLGHIIMPKMMATLQAERGQAPHGWSASRGRGGGGGGGRAAAAAHVHCGSAWAPAAHVEAQGP